MDDYDQSEQICALRDCPRHRERGPKRYQFTQADLAAALGMSVVALRKAVVRRQVHLEDIRSVMAFAVAR